MMDEAFISSDILEPLIRPVTVYALQGDFVLLHFCRKAEFDLLLSMMSSVQSSRQLVFLSVIKCSLSHTPSCFTHLSYLNSRGLQILWSFRGSCSRWMTSRVVWWSLNDTCGYRLWRKLMKAVVVPEEKQLIINPQNLIGGINLKQLLAKCFHELNNVESWFEHHGHSLQAVH